jgi:paraquat-inducible protein A
MAVPHVIACHDCDLLQRAIALPPGGVAKCCRCDARLYRERHAHSPERAAALLLAALLLFAAANVFPIMGMDVQGHRSAARLIDAVLLIHEEGMPEVAAIVFATTMLAPLFQICLLLAALVPLLTGRTPAYLPRVLRMVHATAPWSMVEVFMLGVLVALVKLVHIATLFPGLGLWSFALLIVTLTGAIGEIHPKDLWHGLQPAR